MMKRKMTDLQPARQYYRQPQSNSVTAVGKLLLSGCLLLGLVSCGSEDGAPLPPIVNTPASLTALTLSSGQLNPAFDPMVTSYSTMFIGTNNLLLTPIAPDQTITVNGAAVASGSPSAPISLPPGTTTIPITVTSSTGQTKTYTIEAHQLGQEAYAKASNTNGSDQFGFSVAAEGNTLVVGAPSEDSSATGVNGNQTNNTAGSSGAVYVFTRTGTTWTQQAYIKASNTGAGDQFGISVALDGDTLAVGAYFEDSIATGVGGNEADNTAADSGAVYVFTRTGTTWTQQAYIKASNTGAGDQFGRSLALDGNTLAVGAVAEDGNATGVGGNEADNSASTSGAVYVFTRTGTTWTQQAYIKASNTGAGDQFGINVAIAGDTLAVGAHMEDGNGTGVNSGVEADNSATDSGAVYVFTRTGTTWAQQAYIKAFNTGGGDQFGRSVAVSGDTLAVGAYREDSSGMGVNSGAEADNSTTDSGAVYVFTRTGTTWTQQAYIKASNASANYRLGFAIALEGDTLVAGSSAEDSASTGVGGDQNNTGAADSGAVYVFTRNGTTWTQQAYVKASNTGAGDQFGVSVAVSGDTLAVGASTEDSNGTGINSGAEADNSATDSGAVYILR
ncbi:MAG: cadherin-like beta sandwich domain-containing protein [Nitrospira sp.]|nr:cadherin-like beta sandwich domain-containing protein [Nitrospira sp.]MDH4244448.1 cadherin-like beta sandwich domain-containing protein [Nitrospira sp.]MDH4357679.1 cadherin-like beta sandwich domain-containing protein [Nitrospira sp.]MDH5320230.1 cadherin-like beta sandwich domain-containing protein [Nitrospira sp.]